MMERRNTKYTLKDYLTIVTLVLALIGNAIGIGYTIRKIDEHDSRIAQLETNGSIQSRIAARDIEWIREKLGVIEKKLDEHMKDK